jgi:hypothetical protein
VSKFQDFYRTNPLRVARFDYVAQTHGHPKYILPSRYASRRLSSSTSPRLQRSNLGIRINALASSYHLPATYSQWARTSSPRLKTHKELGAPVATLYLAPRRGAQAKRTTRLLQSLSTRDGKRSAAGKQESAPEGQAASSGLVAYALPPLALFRFGPEFPIWEESSAPEDTGCSGSLFAAVRFSTSAEREGSPRESESQSPG